MKTAISVPDSVFKAAERLARELGMSRSELYTKAVAAFIEQYRRKWITEQLNRVYETESNSLDPVLAQLQSSVLTRETW
jgi:metal-responsive CopG/Arc/MetJ family transcriptional regulator